MKNIAILGSTGSIGTQALEIIDQFPDRFRVSVLSANRNVSMLVAQCLKYTPDIVVINDESCYQELKNALNGKSIRVASGKEALAQATTFPQIDIVLAAMVGFAGLSPVLAAIGAGKTIALANKETLVVAGSIITKLAKTHHVTILPVDSEHSAIFQCLVGEAQNGIEKVILTASGGPFRGYSRAQLEAVTVKESLKHPNWSMGPKITIDSATMMNKGLEVIEAKWLFDLDPGSIEVVIHPQSIIHSLVQFRDGSIKAQLGLPDMRLPIQYAFTFPERPQNHFPRFSFTQYPALTFEPVDKSVFRSLGLAYEAMRLGGNIPCALNAANEIAVEAYLQHKIKFTKIFEIQEQSMAKVPTLPDPALDDLYQTDHEARQIAKGIIKM